jgi:8-oxo-dGTP pyrophosphatase MutT (NUDIX family)
VIRRGDCYLVCQRPSHKRHGGLWEFPGGKLEAGESLFDAATRELKEELDVDVMAIGKRLLVVQDDGSPFQIEFVEVEIVGDPLPLEHDEIAWLTPLEIPDLSLAPSDRKFAISLAGIRIDA